jgi:HAD superfamily hydrolase (TIGR01549 family)
MPSVILFDLDDTLNDRGTSIQHYTEIFLTRYQSRLIAPDLAASAALIRRADRNGYRPKSEIFAELRQTLPWRDAPTVEELTSHWFEYFPSAIQARTHAHAVLGALKRHGFVLGMVTNGNVAGQGQKVDRLGLRPLFSVIVISEQFGVAKPDPAIFLHAVKQLGGQAGETWFVGDHPTNDIRGAAGAGLKPVWLRGIHSWPAPFPEPEAQIDSLDQLLPMLAIPSHVQ